MPNYPLLQILDTDETTVTWDFNDPTGATNPNAARCEFGLGGRFNLNAPQRHYTRFSPDGGHGGTTPFVRGDLSASSFRVRLRPKSAAGTLTDLRTDFGTMARLIAAGGTWKWQESAAQAARFVDVEPSDFTALYSGQDFELNQIIAQLDTPKGIEIVITRQPFLRDVTPVTGALAVQNDPAGASGRHLPLTVQGDAPTPVTLLLQANAASAVESVLVASRKVTSQTDWEAVRYLQADATAGGWTVTLGTDTTSVADATASGGNTAQVTFTSPTMLRRTRMTRTANLGGLRGDLDVYARVKSSASSKITMQLKWAPSLADPVTEVGPEVSPPETTALTTFGYVDVKLGTITVPQTTTLAGIALEVWARRDSGTGNLLIDTLNFVPTETQGTIVVPGGGEDQWLGKELVRPTNPGALVAGSVVGNNLLLNADEEAGGTPPVGGLAWPAGRHRITFQGLYLLFSGTVRFKLRNITDSTDSVVSDVVRTGGAAVFGPKVIEIDSVAGKSYQPQVHITSYSSGSIYVGRVRHTFVPALASTESAITRPELRPPVVEKLDSSNALLGYLAVNGAVPVTLDPGLQMIYLAAADVKLAGYTLGESVIGRVLTVAYSYQPRRVT